MSCSWIWVYIAGNFFYSRFNIMTAEGQIKEENTMSSLAKVPSNVSIRGEKEEEDEYCSYADSAEETHSENSCDSSPQFHDAPTPKFSLAVAFLKKLHLSVVQKKGGATLEDIEWQDSFLTNNDGSFPNDPTGELHNSWGAAESEAFQIRGETYLKDRKKITGKGQLMELVASNMLKSTTKQDDFAGRPGSICQKFAAANCPDFFFIVNMQIPGPTTNFHIAFYYSTTTPIKDVPLLQNFVDGDDAYRNARFKLIPRVAKGSWFIKQSVGNRPCLLGQILKIQYVRGKNYLELDVDVGSSVIAKKVANRVLGAFNNLIVEAAFVIQGNTPEELPEHLLGTCRVSHIDTSKVACT